MRAGLTAAGALLVAACAPTRSLTPGRPTRSGATSGSTPPQATAVATEDGTPKPLPLTTPTARPVETRAAVAQSSASRATGRTVGALGREYRAYPEVSGTVQFAHVWDGPRIALVEGWIADLAAISPSIKVESDPGDAASARERLVTALAAGSPPNAVMLKADGIAYFADRGALLALEPLLDRDGIADGWFAPPERASRSWDGHLYGLPQTTDGAQHLLFVNLGLLERIGVDPARPIRTWQDLDALVEPAARAGLLVLDPGRIPVGMTAHQVWTYANGGRYWDEDLRKIGWTEPAGIQAAEWLLQVVKRQAEEYEQVRSSGDPRAPFSVAEWAADRYVCSINGAGWFFELQQQGQRLRYAAYEIPRNGLNPASRGETPTTGGWTLAIPKSARDQEAAWEWLKLATVSESACAAAERQRRPSPLAGCDARANLETAQPFWPAIEASLAKSVAVPASPMQPQLEQVYRQMQDDVLTARLAPADALEVAARDAQQLLDDWQAKRKRP